MKMDYYEAFDLIAEEAVDLLVENNSDSEFLNKFSVDETLNAVRVTKKRVPLKIRFLIAAVLILSVSTIAFADKKSGAQLITDENRHLVGKNGVVKSEDILVKDENGNIVQGTECNGTTEEIWKTSTVIKHVKNALPPDSLTEIAVKTKGDMCVTPEIITWNGDLVILTKEDGSGWYLESGQVLTFSVELYVSDINSGQGQSMAFYKIYNGTFWGEECEMNVSNNKTYQMLADANGEYYVAFKNYSSDSISLKEGKIYITNSIDK